MRHNQNKEETEERKHYSTKERDKIAKTSGLGS